MKFLQGSTRKKYQIGTLQETKPGRRWVFFCTPSVFVGHLTTVLSPCANKKTLGDNETLNEHCYSPNAGLKTLSLRDRNTRESNTLDI
jgi:hypothetical protein